MIDGKKPIDVMRSVPLMLVVLDIDDEDDDYENNYCFCLV